MIKIISRDINGIILTDFLGTYFKLHMEGNSRVDIFSKDRYCSSRENVRSIEYVEIEV